MKNWVYLATIGFIFLSCQNAEKSKKNQTEQGSQDQTVVETPKKNPKLLPIDTDEALVATALMAAPAESRAGCTVIGYNMAGEFVTFKEGNNEFICLTDDPKKPGFNAACYHKDLDPFMARGRELKKEGKSSKEIFDIREAEVKSGQLSMGQAGLTLHIYHGKESQYDPETHEVAGAKYRYVVYMPWATAESTGLPEVPLESNHPWIMNPGTHRAHIMITPLNETK
ncbi:hypothetical protein [Sediminicola luteus]|uniref:Uncharacterized protein n=1 Tax=Sediminicola luteus TaxID=319238 RepID=A0A2A4G7Y6_9FLAO|nr:hypothetical protein [Sediminicola luteus]PCE64074.1 hypothetical protein B7P33_12610 [Sediminicola luteus]